MWRLEKKERKKKNKKKKKEKGEKPGLGERAKTLERRDGNPHVACTHSQKSVSYDIFLRNCTLEGIFENACLGWCWRALITASMAPA